MANANEAKKRINAEIMDLYKIPNKEDCFGEIKFVKAYRDELKNIIHGIIEHTIRSKPFSYGLKSQVANMIDNVCKFIKSPDRSNVQRKLIFVDNVTKEALDFASDIFNSDDRVSNHIIMLAADKIYELANLVKLELSKTLMKDDTLDKLEQKEADLVVNHFVSGFKDGALDIIGNNNLSLFSAKLFHLYTLFAEEREKENLNSVCKGCEKEECSAYCDGNARTKRIEKKIAAYKVLQKASRYYLTGYENDLLSSKEINDALANFKNEDFKSMVRRILIDRDFNSDRQHIIVATDPTKCILIEDKINAACKNSSSGDKIDKIIRKNLNFLLKFEFDDNQKLHNDFINLYNDLSNKEKEVYNTELGKYYLQKKAEMEESKGDN